MAAVRVSEGVAWCHHSNLDLVGKGRRRGGCYEGTCTLWWLGRERARRGVNFREKEERIT